MIMLNLGTGQIASQYQWSVCQVMISSAIIFHFRHWMRFGFQVFESGQVSS